jgi:hypothetical protein
MSTRSYPDTLSGAAPNLMCSLVKQKLVWSLTPPQSLPLPSPQQPMAASLGYGTEILPGKVMLMIRLGMHHARTLPCCSHGPACYNCQFIHALDHMVQQDGVLPSYQ